MAALSPIAFLVFLIAAGIVATFIFTVHKFLKDAK